MYVRHRRTQNELCASYDRMVQTLEQGKREGRSRGMIYLYLFLIVAFALGVSDRLYKDEMNDQGDDDDDL